MRTTTSEIIEVTGNHEADDGPNLMIPYGKHYGRGRDFSLQVSHLDVQFLMISGKPDVYRVRVHGIRVQHLKDGLRAVNPDDFEIAERVIETVDGLDEIVAGLSEVAAHRWAEITHPEGTQS